MTYRELLSYAQKKIDNNEITVGEYVEMTKVLNREVDVLDKIRAEINGIEINGQIDEHTLFVRGAEEVKNMALNIIDKYRNEVSK